jgi:hypothetical protein
METILRYLKQPSTQQAILALIGIVGYQIAPENLENIILGIAAVFTVVQGFRDEDKKTVETVETFGTTVPGPRGGGG